MSISSPQPSVLHLVTIFRQITSGDIRIPAFQRDFVWRERQMLELLDSVLEGYPIGSILLWGVDQRMLKIAPTEMTSFPEVEEQFPTSYVLDGMQRLSTLYGVFHHGASTNDPRFEVFYDLKEQRFIRRDISQVTESAVPLAALFVPRRLLEHQGRLSKLEGGDALIEQLLALQAAFQDYMVPVVTIRSTDVARIVGIFEKINSTGTRLDPIDFMRAITWAEDFDLNHALDSAAGDLADLGFELNAETIIKCVGLTLSIPPTTDGLLQLRSFNPKELRSAFDAAIDGLKRTSVFLHDSLGIQSSVFVPYEGQLLLLFRTIGMEEAEHSDIPAIVRWYWAAGFNESLRGKPDHYVVRSLENWRELIAGEIRGLEPRLRLEARDLEERRLVSGAALSSTFATMHAANRARSLATGDEISAAAFMSGDQVASFEPILTRATLAAAGFRSLVSAKLFGNLILFDADALEEFGAGGAAKALAAAVGRGDWDALKSQFVDEQAYAFLERAEHKAFIQRRANLMIDKALSLVGEVDGDR